MTSPKVVYELLDLLSSGAKRRPEIPNRLANALDIAVARRLVDRQDFVLGFPAMFWLTAEGRGELALYRENGATPEPEAGTSPSPPTDDDQGKPSRQKDSLSLEERAIALFFSDPTLTKVRMAERLGCNSRSLAPKRCLKLAAAMKAYQARDLPRGSKDADGNVEAWDDE